MKCLKKKINKDNGIFKFEINDSETKKVTNFYKESPFPNYKSNDDKSTILDKGNKNYLTSKFKNFIGYKKDVLEVGCGTGQLAIYFALGTNNRVVGLDPTIESLKLAANFSKKHNIENIDFVNADIFDDVLTDKFFDFIWCNGVLHHTKDPYEAFRILIKSLKNEGYVLIGLYNKMGRIRTVFRRYMFKLFGSKFLDIFDPTLRNLKDNVEERNAWIRDQYIHPIESLHTIDNVLEWFDKNDIEFINSIPSSNFDEDEGDLFSKKSKGDLYSRISNQLSMIFNNLGSDGGLFIVIGKKNV
jgi:SAM-dependent methyltransferase|tara:strand:+ start:551 stop:1450 length:900 start_codon:yes stop_codon:yes gene_type:complete